MKRAWLCCVVVLCLLVTMASAQTLSTKMVEDMVMGGSAYVGAKGGMVLSGIAGFDNPVNAGVVGGYQLKAFPLVVPGVNLDLDLLLAVEGEFTTSIISGDASVVGVTGDWDYTLLAGYAVCRTAGDIYAKVKLGLMYEKGEATFGAFSGSDTDMGLTSGIGGGMKIGPGMLEAEIAIIEENINFLTLSYLYAF